MVISSPKNLATVLEKSIDHLLMVDLLDSHSITKDLEPLRQKKKGLPNAMVISSPKDLARVIGKSIDHLLMVDLLDSPSITRDLEPLRPKLYDAAAKNPKVGFLKLDCELKDRIHVDHWIQSFLYPEPDCCRWEYLDCDVFYSHEFLSDTVLKLQNDLENDGREPRGVTKGRTYRPYYLKEFCPCVAL